MLTGVITRWSSSVGTGQLRSSTGVIYEFPSYACRGFEPKRGLEVFIQAEMPGQDGPPRAVVLGLSAKRYVDPLVAEAGKVFAKKKAIEKRDYKRLEKSQPAFDREWKRVELEAKKAPAISWKERCSLAQIKVPKSLGVLRRVLETFGWSRDEGVVSDPSLIAIATRDVQQLCILAWPEMKSSACNLVIAEGSAVVRWCGKPEAMLATIQEEHGERLEELHRLRLDDSDPDRLDAVEFSLGRTDLGGLFPKKPPLAWRAFVEPGTPERKAALALRGRTEKRARAALLSECKRLGWKGHVKALEARLRELDWEQRLDRVQ